MCSFSPQLYWGIPDKKNCIFKVCKYFDICVRCEIISTMELINIYTTSYYKVFLKCWALSGWIHVIHFVDTEFYPLCLTVEVHCQLCLSPRGKPKKESSSTFAFCVYRRVERPFRCWATDSHWLIFYLLKWFSLVQFIHHLKWLMFSM